MTRTSYLNSGGGARHTACCSAGLITLLKRKGAEFSVKRQQPLTGAAIRPRFRYAGVRFPTNLGFLSTLMWDGRESRHRAREYHPQYRSAARTAHQAVSLPPLRVGCSSRAGVQDIVNFETALRAAGLSTSRRLSERRQSNGGPAALASQRFFIGINDSFPASLASIPPEQPSIPIFQPVQAWTNSRTPSRPALPGDNAIQFKPITISGVAGINDVAGLPRHSRVRAERPPNAGTIPSRHR